LQTINTQTWHAVRLLALFSLIAALLVACGQPAGQGAGGDLSQRTVRAVATTGMVADVVQNIGGERVEVTALMGPGVDPHLYKASAGDVERLQAADVVFYNGLHLEAAMGEVLERMAGRARTVAVAEGIDPAQLLASDTYADQHDPHVWFDVRLWQKAAERVRDTFVEIDPASAEVYRANAERYLGELDALHSYVLERAESVPAEQRVLITAHDAFRYFGRAYGFDVRGLQGISTASEAGAADVQDLAEFIATREIRAVFVESSVPQRTIEAVQAAVAARGFEVAIGGELFSDAMDAPGTPTGTYIGMVRHNIDTIVGALTQE
jgi:manganese/zinc/iron transport system substrate-binding protein